MPLPTSSPARPLVIALHASAANGRAWQPFAERMEGAARVVAPDLAGHGSRGPAWPGDREDILAVDAATVLDLAAKAAGLVHLVGHSWGGAVALRAARARPECFASVAVYEPVAFRLLRDRFAATAAKVAWVGRAIGADVRGRRLVIAARRFVDFWNGAGSFDALPPPRREAIAVRMTAVAAQFTALWQDPAPLAALRALAMPVQLYYGTHTLAATRRIVELLAAALPDARVQRMTAMGHMGPITHPHSFAQALAAFVGAQVGRDDVAPLARAA